MIAADYPFFDLILSMAIFFLWIVWIWILIEVIADIFRRHDVSGWTKTAWLIFVILLPFLGVFVYLITQNVGMTERKLARARAKQDQFDAYVRERAATTRWRLDRGDREGEAAARQRRDHAGRVRGAQAEGARLASRVVRRIARPVRLVAGAVSRGS